MVYKQKLDNKKLNSSCFNTYMDPNFFHTTCYNFGESIIYSKLIISHINPNIHI